MLIADDDGLCDRPRSTPRPTARARPLRRRSSTSSSARLREAAGAGASPLDYAELLVNDLEQAAVSLRPEIAEALAALDEAAPRRVLVTGSGPTAVGLFADLVAADAAASALPPRYAQRDRLGAAAAPIIRPCSCRDEKRDRGPARS